MSGKIWWSTRYRLVVYTHISCFFNSVVHVRHAWVTGKGSDAGRGLFALHQIGGKFGTQRLSF